MERNGDQSPIISKAASARVSHSFSIHSELLKGFRLHQCMKMAMLHDIKFFGPSLSCLAYDTAHPTLQIVLRTAMVFGRDRLASHRPKPYPRGR